MNTKRFLFLILAVVVLFLPLSCLGLLSPSPKPSGWDKDYYDYQIGAIINGKEYHEAPEEQGWWFDVVSDACGFTCEKYDSLYFISNTMTGIYEFTDSINNESYDLAVEIITDSASFIANKNFFFNGIVREFHWDQALYNGEYEKLETLPIVWGVFTNTSVKGYRGYLIKEGSISTGSFFNGRNAETIFFDFLAEDEKGEVIEVKKGYCKQYVKEK